MKTQHTTQRRIRGRSLIELLVAMLIALITMAAVLYAISGTSVTGDQQNVYAQFNEEAAVASSLLNAHFKNAGFGIPRNIGVISGASDYVGPPMFGCENGFLNVAALTCTGGTENASPDAVAVYYQATQDNTDFTGANPVDCLGQAMALGISPTTGVNNYAQADNRYFVQDGSLMCAGPGNPWVPQALINNVIDMQITYGVAAVTPDGADGHGIAGTTPVTYLRADEVTNLLFMPAGSSGLPDNDLTLSPWQRVVNVRICLELASEANALSEPMNAYTNCRGVRTEPADRRLYRAINVVITMRNRAPPCADSSIPLPTAGTDPSWCPASSNIGR